MRNFIATAVVFAACAWSGIARAQHAYDIGVQQMGGQLVVAGCCSGPQWSTSIRVFSSELSPQLDPNKWSTTNPGYGAFGAGSPSLPAGTQPLPGGQDVFWDFMPMIINGVSQNVFYWNGLRPDGQPGTTPADVNFGPLPEPDYTFNEYDKTPFPGQFFSADGTNSINAGGSLGATNSTSGALHFHRTFFLQNGDGSTPPIDGIYLIAERFRMNGLLNSDPAFIVFGTTNAPLGALDTAAMPWVTQHVNMLSGVAGDFNRNGVVDAADYVLWRMTVGQTGSTLLADWNYNNQVDAGDYTVWRGHFGALLPTDSGAGAAVVVVPEPAGGWLFLLALAAHGLVAGRSILRRMQGIRHSSL